MEKTSVQRLARVLRLLVWTTFALNLFCLLLVPGVTGLVEEGGPRQLLHYLVNEVANGYVTHTLGHVGMYFVVSFAAVWQDLDTAVWTVFFWVCGTCTAVMLRQALHILDTILQGEPFQMANARSMKRAAFCCWGISGAALVRLILWLLKEENIAPLFTYTCLFIPVFFMAGLLFQVMSALFRQAAELKEDQDLTI